MANQPSRKDKKGEAGMKVFLTLLGLLVVWAGYEGRKEFLREPRSLIGKVAYHAFLLFSYAIVFILLGVIWSVE